jgi:acyl-CoA thioester hydrolase
LNPGPDREVKSRIAGTVHEKRIEIRWRDVDAFRHVNNAVYATYLEECRDELFEQVLARVGDPWAYVLARVAIDFRRELTQEDAEVVVRCAIARVGRSSVALREEIRALDGALSAEAEAALVARDRVTGRSRPWTDAEREAFELARGDG